jgi:3-isopropylmalate dehydratase small subunit
MELKLIFEFIKKYWVQSLIAILIATIFYLNVSNSLLESKLALAEQKNVQIEERLTVSNASIEQLQIKLNEQNVKLQELSDTSKEKQESLKELLDKEKQKTDLANQNLEEYINSKEGLTDNICLDTLNELVKIGG